MNLAAYTATALSRNDIEDTPTNKNIVDGAIVELKDLDGNLVVIYDDAAGANPETQKSCDTNGQLTFWAEVGDYILIVNGSISFITIGASIKFTQQSRQAIEAVYKAQGYNNVFFFEDGFTYTESNDVGIYEDGTAWIYADAGAIPVTIASGTVPSEGVYNRVRVKASSVEFDGGESVQDFKDNLSAAEIANENGGSVQDFMSGNYKTCADLQDDIIRGGSFTVELYGDSTMWGSIPNDSLNQFARHPGVILQEVLLGLFKSSSITVANSAIPGSSLYSMIAGTGPYTQNFDDVMASSSAELIYCNHAHNDYFSGNSTLEEYRDNLIVFVNTVRKHGKVPVLCTPNITNYTSDATGVADYARVYKAWVDTMKAVASNLKVDLVDQYYYTRKTARSVGRKVVAPDGVHLSEKAIRYVGANMAIPLCKPIRLDNAGDGDALTGGTYYDDISVDRFFRTSDDNKHGAVMSGNSGALNQRINVPILLDNPTDDNFVAISCLKYDGGGNARLTHNGTFTGDFDGTVDFGHPTLDYNEYVSGRCDLWAGLSLIGVFTNTSVVSGAAGFSMAGVELMRRNFVSTANTTEIDPYKNLERPLMERDEITFSIYFDSLNPSNTYLTLNSCINKQAWLVLKSEFEAIKLTVQGNETVLSTTALDGFYNVFIRIDGFGSVSYKIGGISGSTATTSDEILRSYISSENTENKVYNVVRDN